MKRDYVKRSSYRKKTKNNYLYLWLILLFLFTAFVVSLVVFNKYKNKLPKIRQRISVGAVTKTIEKADATAKLEFYNILPQKKDIKSDTTYELEIATVNDFTVADHLKAELALLGFAASITPVYQQGAQKHYISIGPYDSKNGAIADQQKLKINNIKSVLKKMH